MRAPPLPLPRTPLRDRLDQLPDRPSPGASHDDDRDAAAESMEPLPLLLRAGLGTEDGAFIVVEEVGVAVPAGAVEGHLGGVAAASSAEAAAARFAALAACATS